jgi:hypothetical protein
MEFLTDASRHTRHEFANMIPSRGHDDGPGSQDSADDGDDDECDDDEDRLQGKRINFPKLLANNCYPSQLSTV